MLRIQVRGLIARNVGRSSARIRRDRATPDVGTCPDVGKDLGHGPLARRGRRAQLGAADAVGRGRDPARVLVEQREDLLPREPRVVRAPRARAADRN